MVPMVEGDLGEGGGGGGGGGYDRGGFERDGEVVSTHMIQHVIFLKFLVLFC